MKKVSVLLLALVTLVSSALACGQSRAPTPSPIPTLAPLPLQAPGWEDVTVRTLCLEVEQSYPGIEGKSPEPVAETVQGILARLGVSGVSEGESCDATLTIALTGKARGAEYIGAGYCYSGAEISGEMVLTVPEHAPLTLSIDGKYPPPVMIAGCPEGPVDAPFEKAWLEALFEGLTHLWGPQVLIRSLKDERGWAREIAAKELGECGPEEGVVSALIQALEDGDEDVREAAADALAEIGPHAVEAVPALIVALGDDEIRVRYAAALALGQIGPGAREAIPALIQALGDKSSSVRQAAVKALRAITGQDFGEDAERWQQWWEAHQLDTPMPAPSGCTPDAVFEADVTVPDGTQVKAGQAFVKTWRVRNTGTCDWDASYRLVFVEGERMGGPDSVAVPETPAGGSASISVELLAPLEEGEHRGYWQMCTEGARRFGDRVYVEIISTK